MQNHTTAVTDIELRRHCGDEIGYARAVLLRISSGQGRTSRADAIDERLIDVTVTVVRLTLVRYICCPAPGRYRQVDANKTVQKQPLSWRCVRRFASQRWRGR